MFRVVTPTAIVSTTAISDFICEHPSLTHIRHKNCISPSIKHKEFIQVLVHHAYIHASLLYLPSRLPPTPPHVNNKHQPQTQPALQKLTTTFKDNCFSFSFLDMIWQTYSFYTKYSAKETHTLSKIWQRRPMMVCLLVLFFLHLWNMVSHWKLGGEALRTT